MLAPAALNFFVNYADGAVESLWSIDQYFEFVLVLMLSTGLSFQVGGWRGEGQGWVGVRERNGCSRAESCMQGLPQSCYLPAALFPRLQLSHPGATSTQYTSTCLPPPLAAAFHPRRCLSSR